GPRDGSGAGGGGAPPPARGRSPPPEPRRRPPRPGGASGGAAEGAGVDPHPPSPPLPSLGEGGDFVRKWKSLSQNRERDRRGAKRPARVRAGPLSPPAFPPTS